MAIANTHQQFRGDVLDGTALLGLVQIQHLLPAEAIPKGSGFSTAMTTVMIEESNRRALKDMFQLQYLFVHHLLTSSNTPMIQKSLREHRTSLRWHLGSVGCKRNHQSKQRLGGRLISSSCM